MSTAAEILDRAQRLSERPGRALLGIVGLPGAGKTTVALWLVDELRARGVPAAHVPMDGFHLSDAALDALGRRDRKGAIDTFDGDGYLALLRRLREEQVATVWAPAFDRAIEQPIAGSIAVSPETELVVSEGNYLLMSDAPWPGVRRGFDEVWFADVDQAARIERLVARHVRFGKTPDEAARWVHEVDETNARAIDATRHLADLTVDVDDLGAWREA